MYVISFFTSFGGNAPHFWPHVMLRTCSPDLQMLHFTPAWPTWVLNVEVRPSDPLLPLMFKMTCSRTITLYKPPPHFEKCETVQRASDKSQTFCTDWVKCVLTRVYWVDAQSISCISPPPHLPPPHQPSLAFWNDPWLTFLLDVHRDCLFYACILFDSLHAS